MTQETAIYKHLCEHKGITSMEAFQLYGVTRLSAKIFDLRHKKGIKIKTEQKQTMNRYGHNTNYVQYSLVSDMEE